MSDEDGPAWHPDYLSRGPTGGPGWYAVRTVRGGRTTTTFHGPFRGERECRGWCDAQDGDGTAEPADEPVEVPAVFGERGQA